MHTLSRSVTVILVIGWHHLLFAQNLWHSPEQVLHALRKSDQIFWQGYSLSLLVEAPDFWQQTVSYRLRATSDQGTVIVIRDQVRYHGAPPYRVLEGWNKQSFIQSDKLLLDGALPYIRWVQTWYLQEGKLYTEAEKLETVFVLPDNTVQSASSRSNISLFIHRSSNCPSHNWLKYAENALGRGFSRYLGNALSHNRLPDGRLELLATDREVAENRWRLVIDPAHQFLVVNAELLQLDGTVREQWQTEGVVETSVPVAKRGVMYRYYDGAQHQISRFACVSYERCFQTDWYAEVRQLIRRPPAGSRVIDYRTEPFTTFIIKSDTHDEKNTILDDR